MRSAACGFDRPAATSSATCSSVGVSDSHPRAGRLRVPRARLTQATASSSGIAAPSAWAATNVSAPSSATSSSSSPANAGQSSAQRTRPSSDRARAIAPRSRAASRYDSSPTATCASGSSDCGSRSMAPTRTRCSSAWCPSVSPCFYSPRLQDEIPEGRRGARRNPRSARCGEQALVLHRARRPYTLDSRCRSL